MNTPRKIGVASRLQADAEPMLVVDSNEIDHHHPASSAAVTTIYDEELLKNTFGIEMLHQLKINEGYSGKFAKKQFCPNMEFKFFKKNFIQILNKGLPLPCFVTSNGALAVYEFPQNDAAILNQLLHFVLWKFSKEFIGYEAKSFLLENDDDDDEPTLYFRDDRLTRFFNIAREPISTLPKTCFKGQVAIKIIGLQIEEEKKKKTVKLLIHLHQVRVAELPEHEENDMYECLFPAADN